MKTEFAAFVLLFTIILINCCSPVYSQDSYVPPIDTSGEKIISREVKCLGEDFFLWKFARHMYSKQLLKRPRQSYYYNLVCHTYLHFMAIDKMLINERGLAYARIWNMWQ